jgi:acyl-CoA synthetase (AMP-forming)/AMP-acid ligase II
MKGYLKNPRATSDMIDEDGWLHSGDIGYADDDGYLFVVDRVKELIKYKGMQVAPAELEGVIQAHPAVADAAVIPVPVLEVGEIPKAFVVLKPDARATAEEIMAHVAASVAPHKKVRQVEFIDAIPKVPSGKILRRELRERDRAAREGGT